MATAILASGCASTSSQQQSAAPDSNLFASADTDQIGKLLKRIDQSKAHSNDITDNDFAEQALAYLGTRYKYGGESPSGFDCSGLVWFVAKETLGIKLPRTSADQAKLGVQVKRAELQRGDLVFFNTVGRRYSHVGIYLGGGEFVHAPSRGGKVRVEKLSARYWNSRYNGARRIEADTQTQLASN